MGHHKFVQWIIDMSNIHHLNLAGLDLNLLVVFDALMKASPALGNAWG
jgi:hypothetical protein